MRYYLSTFPPDPLFTRLEALTTTWQGPSASLPHLTLVSPRVCAPGCSEDALIVALMNVTQQMTRFPIRLVGLGSFNERQNIHICVERTSEVVDCHQRLVNATQHLLIPPNGSFVHLEHPHITIADHLPTDRRMRAWEALSKEQFEGEFICCDIHLLRRAEQDQRWTPIFHRSLM